MKASKPQCFFSKAGFALLTYEISDVCTCMEKIIKFIYSNSEMKNNLHK